MRTDSLQHKGQADPRAYEESIKLGNEIAAVLRRNIVQAQRVASDTDERWSEYPLLFALSCLTPLEKSGSPSTPNLAIMNPLRVPLRCLPVARVDRPST